MSEAEAQVEADTSAREQPFNDNVTFISHASEDKITVKNIADTLLRYRVNVWYDAYEITIGDSISDKINEGLTRSTYGVVVLSHNFFKKEWTRSELGALRVLLKRGNLLPVFHGITVEDLKRYDPMLLDIRGESTDDISRIASIIARKILGEGVPEKHGRLYYENRTISLVDVPLGPAFTIENVTFKNCVLQGPAILNTHENVEIVGLTTNTEHVWLPVIPGRPFVGGLGVRNVSIINCRLKDIGITALPEVMAKVATIPRRPDGWDWPDNLQ